MRCNSGYTVSTLVCSIVAKEQQQSEISPWRPKDAAVDDDDDGTWLLLLLLLRTASAHAHDCSVEVEFVSFDALNRMSPFSRPCFPFFVDWRCNVDRDRDSDRSKSAAAANDKSRDRDVVFGG
mmetsp:Transcript_15907/g.27115  ORF Transcript_15907/g.27115 Transcript_15907/m.27115 type:complete len:123 (-) Transcript_15907:40-408(-)